jgi:hypothetical protein
MLNSIHYSAYPAGDNASFLFEEYRKLLIKNLIGYLEALEASTGLDLSEIDNKYKDLDISQKFSPSIFSLFSKLDQCCSQGFVPQIIDVLHQLKILQSKEILNSNFQLSSILTENWELDFVNKLRNDHFPNEKGDKTLMLPILSSNLSKYELIFSNLNQRIKALDIDFFEEINTYVTRLKLFNGKAIRGATSASVFGAIYLRLPKGDEDTGSYFAEHIIHETSHLHLDILLAFDKVVLNDDNEKFQAPIRIDPRPMFGIFHATFVLSRMVRLFQRLIKDGPQPEYVSKLEIFKKQFYQGLETVEKSAILTENGKRIKDTFIKTAEI